MLSHKILLIISALSFTQCLAAEMISIEKEIDDDHIIVSRSNGEKLFLEKWNMRFSPLRFEGKKFPADVSPLWVTIYFEDRDPIKWSVEEVITGVANPSKSKSSVHSENNQTIEAHISGDFEGWSGETVFILDNGQVWQQSSYAYTYHYAYRPKVIIFSTDGSYKMIVEGVSDSILVQRIK